MCVFFSESCQYISTKALKRPNMYYHGIRGIQGLILRFLMNPGCARVSSKNFTLLLVVQELHGMLELEFVIMVATIFVCCWTIGEVTDECHRDGGGQEG